MSSTDEPQPPPLPRWVKISGLVLVVCVLGLAVALLLGGGGDDDGHGPGRHDGLQGASVGW